MMRSLRIVWTMILVAAALHTQAQAGAAYNCFCVGSDKDAATAPRAGFALMGGGTDLDEAFRWMCERANGGDFLVLRATGGDDYNPYIQPLCKLNSVATLILPNREAANDRFVAQTIAHAEAIFIAGGDQANYIRFWKNTPVQRGINAAIQRGVPIGGTSAGLAVLGEWAYSAEGDKPNDPNLDSKTALMDPLGPRVTLVQGFLDIPVMKGIITDTHFARRDRMGRLLAFLARVEGSDGGAAVRGLGVEQQAAALVELDGSARVVGKGSAYLVRPLPRAPVLVAGKPVAAFEVRKVEAGGSFNLRGFVSDAVPYSLVVEAGKVRSSRPDGAVY
jgi:cyanophycinase